MFFRKKKSRNSRQDWWHNVIPQNVEFGNSGEARRRRRAHLLKMSLRIFFFVGAFVVVVWIVVSALEFGNAKAFSIVRLEYKTDGALDEAWIREFANLKLGKTQENPIELKRKLESYPQILSAEISRDDSKNMLKISLRERHGIARVFDGKEVKILATDGVLFPTKTGFSASNQVLPFVTDAKFFDDENGFRRIANCEALLKFLDFVRREHLTLLADWESVSVKDLPDELFRENLPQPWALLRVREHKNLREGKAFPNIAEIAFSAQNFEKELALWDSADTRSKLEKYCESAGTPKIPMNVIFISNLKNIHEPILEIRLIPKN